MPVLPIYTEFVRRVAIEFMKRLGGRYGAVHIRMGDYAKRGRVPPINSIIRTLLKGNFSRNDSLYIATEPNRDAKVFRKFHKVFKSVKYADDFKDLIDFFYARIKPGMRDDMLGLVEQLVCVGAYIFVGTSYSNFSGSIAKMRETPEIHFPESLMIANHYTRKKVKNS
jgi:hypothetical protein